MIRRGELVPLGVLVGGILLSTFVAQRIDTRVRDEQDRAFAETSVRLARDLSGAVKNQVALLGSVAALYSASEQVTPPEFDTYVDAQLLGGTLSAFDAIAVIASSPSAGSGEATHQVVAAAGHVPLALATGQELPASSASARLLAETQAAETDETSDGTVFGPSRLALTPGDNLDVASAMPGVRDERGRSLSILASLRVPRVAQLAFERTPGDLALTLVVMADEGAAPIRLSLGGSSDPPPGALRRVETANFGRLSGTLSVWAPRPAPAAGFVPVTTIALASGTAISLGLAALILGLTRSADEARSRAADAEQGRATAEEDRARLFDLALDPICTADLNGYFLELNPAWERTLGWSREELCARPFVDFVHPPDRAATDRAAAALAEGHDVVHFENRYRTKSGELRWLRWAAHADVERERIYAVAHDVTESKEQERALMEAKRRAESATLAKSHFLANMSHEIRTPLNAVIGLTSLLLDTKLESEQASYLRTVRSSGEHLLTIINDVLDFSRIEAGKLELDEAPFDLRACVEDAIDLLAPEAARKQLELGFIIEERPPVKLIGDVGRLRQVLVNLLGNAVKFTQAGEVEVRVRAEWQIDGTYEVRFRVRDTGIGIDPTRRAQLFHAFSQLDASTTRAFGGSGLGLAISKRLVEHMHGNIDVSSEPGKGSIFHFRVRLAASDIPLREPGDYRGDELSGLRVLVVDDNETNRRILADYGRAWSAEVHTASSGEEALATLDASPPFDVLVLDAAMPGMDGLTLAEEIRKRPDGDRAPIVVLSSIGGGNAADARARGIRIDAFASKPIKPAIFFERIVEIVERHAPAGEPAAVLAASPPPPAPDSGAEGLLADLHPLRVLLVEDNPVNQTVATLMLERLGYRPDLAEDGVAAIAALERARYDLVLMDVQMPNMDGLEATRHIVARWQDGARPRIVAMTAHALAADRERCLAAGMNDHISKPIQTAALADTLRSTRPLTRE